MQMLQDQSGVACDGPGGGVEIADGVHSAQRQNDGGPAIVGRRAAGHTAIPALRNDCDVMQHTQPDEGGDFLCVAG